MGECLGETTIITLGGAVLLWTTETFVALYPCGLICFSLRCRTGCRLLSVLLEKMCALLLTPPTAVRVHPSVDR